MPSLKFDPDFWNAPVSESTFQITSYDGASITVHRSTPLSALYTAHGGGLVSLSVAVFQDSIKQYAAEADISIFAVTPFPRPSRDVYSALTWLHDNAANSLGINPERLAIFGLFAGGSIAAGQILMCPMLDDCTTQMSPDHPMFKFLSWSATKNEISWNAYLGAADGKETSEYGAPARAQDLTGLPRTFWMDEVLAYGSRLAAANVDLEMHLYPGVSHGWDNCLRDVPVIKRAEEARVRALQDF
ncbi:arylesterase monooxygenase [Diplogelasinospora grovesii]|uniref:Arylesterase monooxygenase n=1 Tax=Diplogelasinospora grovesii TaxID=303347 RepID=A0AAN6N4T2_9PEZI|nr:arylesterase monooxygenase [Diplogelasinospora grovesii]